MLHLLRRKLKKSQMSLFDAHHVAYDRTTASGKSVHIEAKGTPREPLAHGMKVKYKTPDMPKRRMGTITGGDESGWHVTGQRQGYQLKPEIKILQREHIWTEAEHAAETAPKGTHIAISEKGRILKPEIVNARAKQGAERLGMTEYEVVSNPAITRPAILISGQIARKNHIMSRFTVENGLVANDEDEAMDIYSAYEDAMLNSLRRQTASAPDDMLDEFRDHLQGKRDNSRIAATTARDGKTAAIRRAKNTQKHYRENDEYNTSQEDDFESGMQGISEQSAVAPEVETAATSHTALEANIDHHLSMLKPTDAAIIKMKFGLGRFDHAHKDAEIADSLNRLNHPAPTGNASWTAALVARQAQDALSQLAKTKSVQALRDFLKSMRELNDLRKAIHIPSQAAAYPPPAPRQTKIPNITIPLNAKTPEGETVEVRMPVREAIANVMETIKTLTQMREAIHAGA